MRARSPAAHILAAARYGVAQPRENTSSVFLPDSSVRGVLASQFSKPTLPRSSYSSCGTSSPSAPRRPVASSMLRHLWNTVRGPDSPQWRRFADTSLVHGQSPAGDWPWGISAQSRAEPSWLTRGTSSPPCSPSTGRASDAENVVLRGWGGIAKDPGVWELVLAQFSAPDKLNPEASVDSNSSHYHERNWRVGQAFRSCAACLGAQSAPSSLFTALPSSSILRSLHTRAMPLAAPATGDLATSSAAASPATFTAGDPDQSPHPEASSVTIFRNDHPLPASAATSNASSPAANVGRLHAGEPQSGTRFHQRHYNMHLPKWKVLLSCVSGVNLQACALADGQVSMDLVVQQIQVQWVLHTGGSLSKGARQAAGNEGEPVPEDLRKCVTRALQEINDSSLARGLLQWARQEQGMELRSQHVTVLVKALARAGDLEGVMSIEESFEEDGFSLNEINYCALMNAYHWLGRTQLAFLVPRKMDARNVKMTSDTFDSLMTITLRTGKLHRTWRLFEELQRRGIKPTLFTYSILLEACRVSRDVDLAKTTLHELIKQGLVPNNVTMNTMLTLYKETGNTEDAAALFASLRGLGLEPDIPLCTSYLDLLCKQGLIAEAESEFKDLQGGRLAADPGAISSMVHMYGSRVGAQEALECFLGGVLSGLKPNSRLYACLAYALVLGGSFDETRALLEFMEAREATPRLAISCILLSKCTSTGPDSGNLLALLELLKIAGGEVKDLILLLISVDMQGTCHELQVGRSVPRSQKREFSLIANPCSNAGTDTAHGGQHARNESVTLLKKLLDCREFHEDRSTGMRFAHSLQQFLSWAGLEASAGIVWNILLEHGLFDGKVSLEPSHWRRGVCKVDLHGVNPESTATFVRGVLGRLNELHATRNVLPSQILIITGWGRGSASFNKEKARVTAREVVQCSFRALGLDATLTNKGCFSISSPSLKAWMRGFGKGERQITSSTTINVKNIQQCLQDPLDTSRFEPNASQMEVLNKALSLLRVKE